MNEIRRVLKIIDLHEKVNNDYRTQMTLYKRGVALPLLPQVEHARKLVNEEVQECGAFANQLKPQWGRTIFQEAYQLREKMQERNRLEEDPAEKEERERIAAESRQALEMMSASAEKKKDK